MVTEALEAWYLKRQTQWAARWRAWAIAAAAVCCLWAVSRMLLDNMSFALSRLFPGTSSSAGLLGAMPSFVLPTLDLLAMILLAAAMRARTELLSVPEDLGLAVGPTDLRDYEAGCIRRPAESWLYRGLVLPVVVLILPLWLLAFSAGQNGLINLLELELGLLASRLLCLLFIIWLLGESWAGAPQCAAAIVALRGLHALIDYGVWSITFNLLAHGAGPGMGLLLLSRLLSLGISIGGLVVLAVLIGRQRGAAASS